MKNKGIKHTLKRMGDWLLKGNNRMKVFFLFLSVFLWLLIKLSKPGYVSSIGFPVEYRNMPEDKILMNDPPEYIRLQMEATGFTILKYSVLNVKDLNVDLDNLSFSNGRYYWLPNLDMRDLELQFNENATILDIHPDTVFFNFSPLETRYVSVKPNVKLEEGSSMSLYTAPKANPDSIRVTGPPVALNKLKQIETSTYVVPANSKDSVMGTVELQTPELKNVNFSHREVQVKVQLTRLTEETVEVPIQVLNVPDSLNLELFPTHTQLTYRVALRDFGRLQPELFEVIANYQEVINNPESRFLNLKLEEVPNVIRQVDLDPKRVEYIIIQK